MAQQRSFKAAFGFQDAIELWVQTCWRSGIPIEMPAAIAAFQAEFPKENAAEIARQLRQAASAAGVDVRPSGGRSEASRLRGYSAHA